MFTIPTSLPASLSLPTFLPSIPSPDSLSDLPFLPIALRVLRRTPPPPPSLAKWIFHTVLPYIVLYPFIIAIALAFCSSFGIFAVCALRDVQHHHQPKQPVKPASTTKPATYTSAVRKGAAPVAEQPLNLDLAAEKERQRIKWDMLQRAKMAAKVVEIPMVPPVAAGGGGKVAEICVDGARKGW